MEWLRSTAAQGKLNFMCILTTERKNFAAFLKSSQKMHEVFSFRIFFLSNLLYRIEFCQYAKLNSFEEKQYLARLITILPRENHKSNKDTHTHSIQQSKNYANKVLTSLRIRITDLSYQENEVNGNE